jgi:hypothetical protein
MLCDDPYMTTTTTTPNDDEVVAYGDGCDQGDEAKVFRDDEGRSDHALIRPHNEQQPTPDSAKYRPAQKASGYG